MMYLYMNKVDTHVCVHFPLAVLEPEVFLNKTTWFVHIHGSCYFIYLIRYIAKGPLVGTINSIPNVNTIDNK